MANYRVPAVVCKDEYDTASIPSMIKYCNSNTHQGRQLTQMSEVVQEAKWVDPVMVSTWTLYFQKKPEIRISYFSHGTRVWVKKNSFANGI